MKTVVSPVKTTTLRRESTDGSVAGEALTDSIEVSAGVSARTDTLPMIAERFLRKGEREKGRRGDKVKR
jgi:hypothetical protein